MHRRVPRFRPLVAVLFLFAMVWATNNASAATSPTTAPLPPTNVTLQQDPNDAIAIATWSLPTTGAPVDQVDVQVWVDNGNGGFYNSGYAIIRADQPQRVRIPLTNAAMKVIAVSENAAGTSGGQASAVVTPVRRCATADICVSIGGTAPAPVVTNVAQGFTDGTGQPGASTSTATSLVGALGVTNWRADDPAALGIVKSVAPNAATTYILNTAWRNATLHLATMADGSTQWVGQAPWNDWAHYTSVIQQTVQQAIAQGWAPTYWDIWNEPDGNCCLSMSDSDYAGATITNLLDIYRVGYQAVKSVDPTAKVIGPSLGQLTWFPNQWSRFDLQTFLAYSVANGLQWDAISWHEINNGAVPAEGDASFSTTAIADHIASAQRVMARFPTAVPSQRVFINEFDTSWNHTLPGWYVGYASTFEDAGVALASRACWNDPLECHASTLTVGGILSGSSALPAYWAQRAYGALTGLPRVQASSSSSWQLNGIAVTDAATSSIRAVLGRHVLCTAAQTTISFGNSWCPFTYNIASASVQVRIAWPYGTTPATVKVDSISGAQSTSPSGGPANVLLTQVTPSNGYLTFTVPSVADGDALSISATAPAGSVATTSTNPPATTATTSTTTTTTTTTTRPTTSTTTTTTTTPTTTPSTTSTKPSGPRRR